MLDRIFGSKGVKKADPVILERDGERYEVKWRMLSRDLPGYRGVTLDLSHTGLQLETSGILEIGSVPVLNFDFDRGEMPGFACAAEVIWSKQSERKRVFHSGLRFVPSSDEEIRNLACMSTILRARSTADLQTLLEQANRLDPDLEEAYSRKTQVLEEQQSQPSSPILSSPSSALTEKSSTNTGASHPGVFIPLEVAIESYTWDKKTRMLELVLNEAQACHKLYFPDCQLFQVLEPVAEIPVRGLYCSSTSPVTRKLQRDSFGRAHRHYRFVGPGGMSLLDIVASPCQPKPT